MEQGGQATRPKISTDPHYYDRIPVSMQGDMHGLPGGIPTKDDNKKTPIPKYIYIAGPLNVDSDDEKVNVQNALIAAEVVIQMGAIPYVPHLTLFWDKQFKHPKEYWMILDIRWLHKCDAVYRLAGRSDRADEEVAAAQEAKIPVLFHYAELLDFIRSED